MNTEQLKKDFPILQQKINNKPLIYFDNAATTQKPQTVITKISEYYNTYNANVHRSINLLAETSTIAYENSRKIVADFINAKSEKEIIFTSGTTESLNLLVQSFANNILNKYDTVLLSITEHHSNIIPWLQLSEKIGFKIQYIPLNADGTWDMTVAKKMAQDPSTRIISVAHVSNTLGTINSIEELFSYADKDVIKIIDSAQSIAHLPTDVQKLNCDFLAFSGHKMYAPTGIGILWGKTKHLEEMPPWQGGGDMIKEVYTDKFIVNDLPYKFEAGTPHIAGAIGLGEAIEYIKTIKWENILKIEQQLSEYLMNSFSKLEFVTIYGPLNAENKLPIVAFNVSGVHGHDVADILSDSGIMIRSGHHCTNPLHQALGVRATARASLSVYNTTNEIDVFIEQLKLIYNKFN